MNALTPFSPSVGVVPYVGDGDMGPPPAEPDAPRDEEPQTKAMLDVGMMRLCGRDLAVPALLVREVVPRPVTLHPSFSGSGASIGSIMIRGTVIPVLDIRPNLGLAADSEGCDDQKVIVVLRQGGELVGLLMDSVLGLARVPVASVQQLRFHGGGEHQLVTRSFPLGDAVVGLLDPAAVFGLPDVPHAAEELREEADRTLDARRMVVLLNVADAEIALSADRVAGTVPNAVIRPSPFPGSEWVGVIDYLGREVPVVDDLALFGLSGRAKDTGSQPVLVMRMDDRHLIGLRIDGVRQILQVGAGAVKPLPAALAARLSLFAGAVVGKDGRQSLLLSDDAMIRSDALRMIGELSLKKTVAVAAAATRSQRTALPRAAFLVFRAGTRLRATPLASVTQIIELPSDRTRLHVPGSAVQGIASYNDSPLALIDLGENGDAREIDPAQARVLVVRSEDAFTGFIVDRLETVARSVAQPNPEPDAGDRRTFFIEASVGGRSEAVTVCDLADEARRLA